VIAGIHLPAGHRESLGLPGTPTTTGLWETNRSGDDAIELAERLAAAFPKTGLWPVLWNFPDEPSSYMDGPYDLAAASESASPTLRLLWNKQAGKYLFPNMTFPGLAAASTSFTHRNPFAIFAAHQNGSFDPGDYRLLLIPCTRPADSLSAVGLELSNHFTDGQISSVLRSWEQRFGANVVMFGAGTVVLAVDSPPTSPGAAKRLAYEMATISLPEAVPVGSMTQLTSMIIHDGSQVYDDSNLHKRITDGTWGLGFND